MSLLVQSARAAPEASAHSYAALLWAAAAAREATPPPSAILAQSRAGEPVGQTNVLRKKVLTRAHSNILRKKYVDLNGLSNVLRKNMLTPTH